MSLNAITLWCLHRPRPQATLLWATCVVVVCVLAHGGADTVEALGISVFAWFGALFYIGTFLEGRR